jgi:hypothetical protein
LRVALRFVDAGWLGFSLRHRFYEQKMALKPDAVARCEPLGGPGREERALRARRWS